MTNLDYDMHTYAIVYIYIECSRPGVHIPDVRMLSPSYL